MTNINIMSANNHLSTILRNDLDSVIHIDYSVIIYVVLIMSFCVHTDNDVNGVVLLDMTDTLLEEIGVPRSAHAQLLQVALGVND